MKNSITLSRIAVIGSQSSGKSSVLESIVKEDFLPRGTGIVTRCPLILQLVHKEDCEKYAVFDHLPSKRFSDFLEVREEIILQTNCLAGTGKRIVKDPIRLTITGSDVPNLTLIDLPGFTKIDTDDQEEGVSKGIESLCLDYIQEENTVILALCPATGDIATADSLQYAKMVDPKRERTFGVVTKIDIMDKGTDAMEHLSGCKYRLKHGFIGVKCRSQEDNNNNKLISDALVDEKDFFSSHPVYSSVADQQGTEVLGEKLSKLLTENIIKQLPIVEKFIEERLEESRHVILSLGK